jgi:hypothetical protein
MSVTAVLKMLATVRNIDRKMIMHFKNKLYHAVAFPNDLAARPGAVSIEHRQTSCKKIQLHCEQIKEDEIVGTCRAQEGD